MNMQLDTGSDRKISMPELLVNIGSHEDGRPSMRERTESCDTAMLVGWRGEGYPAKETEEPAARLGKPSRVTVS